MSSREPADLDLSPEDMIAWNVAAEIIEHLCGGVLVAIVGSDPTRGLFVVPRVGVGPTLFRALGDADWANMARTVEEFTP